MMSSALLRKSLALCDPDFEQPRYSKNKQSKKEKQLTTRVTKVNKNQIIQSNRKISVNEARKALKAKEEILKENLKRIKLIKKACTVNLTKEIAEQVIERAVTRKSVKPKVVEEVVSETVFTEEDFKKFEEEYKDY